MSKHRPPSVTHGVGWVEQHVDHWIHTRIRGEEWVPPEIPEHPVMIRKEELLRRVGLSYPTIWQLERDGQFPRRVTLTPLAREAAEG
jgi:predicted DNA-binding transcriptional regulator AlpA